MLERLSITNFAVARAVIIEPGAGLNVFTGETGAGKSLVVDALAFVFGGRRGREVVATGAERATVEAMLALIGGRTVIERTITAGGRSSARIDGEPATVEALQALASGVVDIHGQSEQLAILRPAVQLAVLDEFAGTLPERERIAGIVRELRAVRREAGSLAADSRERERLLDQLRFETEEIAAAGLVSGEDDALRGEQARLANAGRLLEAVAMALSALEGNEVSAAVASASEIATRDPSAGPVAEASSLLETAAADLSRTLRLYRDSLEEDPERLSIIEERLDRLVRLRRKYGETIDDVIAYGREAEQRLASLTGAGASLESLREREAELLAGLAARASSLSAARRTAAGDLVRAIARELAHLGLASATLSVGFACEDDPSGPPVAFPDYEIVITERPPGDEGEAIPRAFTESGVDRIEFLASFNPGESPRPLSAVASGGETSRFLLALTTVLGTAAERRLVVLDEVDEGVGGRSGALVGEALARLAQRHQVLCVTHLPQVAAYADRHFVVSKESDSTGTHSLVTEVTGEARRDELATMLGGLTAANRAAADDLLASRQQPASR